MCSEDVDWPYRSKLDWLGIEPAAVVPFSGI